ncbi:MAG: hypothetical protein ABI806_10010 [Candidatus Solibacter sp.]
MAVLAPILQAVLLLGSILMVLKLYRTGLYKQYPVFFAFFIFRIPNSIWPLILPRDSFTYFYLWVCTIPIVLIFYVLLVVELYKSVLERYRGLYSLGRWVMYASVAIAVMISALSLLPTIKPEMKQGSRAMIYVLASERVVDSALAIFIILMLCFLSFFPLKLGRNVRVHSLLFSVFFLSQTFMLLVRSNFGLKFEDLLNTAVQCVVAASMIAWLTLLRPTDEDSKQAPAALGPEYESRLLAHLDSINSALLKTSRREQHEDDTVHR